MSLQQTARLPIVFPTRPERPTQEDVPDTKADRQRTVEQARAYLAQRSLVPPVPLDDLRVEAAAMIEQYGIEERYLEYCSLTLSNELWKDSLATVPFERRLLLLPKCLRDEANCPAPFDELGLLCKKCGLCSIQDLQVEAERMGYAVLVAEGSPIVMAIIETGKIEAIVGVSCLNVLRKVYSYMEAAAIPGIAIPLLQDDCVDVNVDLDAVWVSVHLTSDDKTRRLDLVSLRDEVDTWFTADGLAEVMGTPETDAERIGHEWLARAGKRWRPFLTVAVYQALQDEPGTAITDEQRRQLRKIAVAVECFHKASLIHDDIEDEDDERYGEATMHSEHGVPIALNVGDLLLGEGYRLLAEIEAPAAARATMLRIAAQGHRTLAVGQGTELAWHRDPKPLKPVDIVGIFRQKTAPAFETALRLGAHFAGADEGLDQALIDYSASLGVAYQIRDDLDDLEAAVRAGEKPERRPTILWALGYQAAKKRDDKAALTAAWCAGGTASNAPAALDAEALYGLFAKLDVTEKGQELLTAYKDEAIRGLRLVENANVKGLLRRTIGKIFDDLQIKGWCNEFEARNASGSEARAAAAG